MKRGTYALFAIFIIVLAVRLLMVFQNPQFSNEAYSTLRQVEHIKLTGLPLYADSLSYQGRTLVFPPLFDYILAFFSLFFSIDLVAKIIPNIFAALLVFVVYKISNELNNNNFISLVAAFMAGFIPVFFIDINKSSIQYFVFLLLFLIVYYFIKLEKKNSVTYILILTVLLVATHPASFLLIIGLLFYLLLAKLEKFDLDAKELELVLFSVFLIFWANLLIYKNAFLVHGPSVIWQNIPKEIIMNFFLKISFLESFYYVGIIPLILGIFSIYNVLFVQKNKKLILIVGFTFSIFILIWFRLIELFMGLMLLGFFMVILASHGMKIITIFLDKSKFQKYKKYILIIFSLVFIVTSSIPAVILAQESLKEAPSKEEIDAFLWIKNNTPSNATVLAPLEEGYLVTYFAQRKNIIEPDFLLIPDINKRYSDVNFIYEVRFEIEAIKKLTEYEVGYIYLSTNTQKRLNLTELPYAEKDCFELVYSKSTKIYKVLCRAELY